MLFVLKIVYTSSFLIFLEIDCVLLNDIMEFSNNSVFADRFYQAESFTDEINKLTNICFAEYSKIVKTPVYGKANHIFLTRST